MLLQVHINLIRDHNTGKSKGFGFLCYMDQRSTVLAVDNLNAVKVLGRIIRVDHIHQYKLPKDLEKLDADKRKLFEEGCAPKELSPVPVQVHLGRLASLNTCALLKLSRGQLP